ncbi:zonular occludens toxin domain-containing protein [Variovorax sp. GB1P17]|uniref:zonular occludens toxin domain-containing protein n=1 Tax=Variovorax sp. GB1P17 TaxID=3443740 RepID=UPI003F45BBF6
MINLLLGAPGAGKSYEAVVFHVLQALMRGRMVITNLPLNVEHFAAIDASWPALIELREKTLAQRPAPRSAEDGTPVPMRRVPEWSERAFANPEDFASTWRHADGFGPLYVVDECHFCMPVGRTSIGVEEWFSMHRHYNADVLLITQSSNKISRAIRDLVQVCYKVRKAVALGKPNGYIRKVLDGVGGGEVSVSERTYQAQYFKLWRSHTQGMAVAEQKADDVSPMLVKFKRFSWAFYAVTLVACIYAFWPAGDKPPAQPRGEAISAPVEASKPVAATSPPAGAEKLASGPDAKPVDPNEVPEPYAAKGLHLTGCITLGKRTRCDFAISMNGQRIADTNSEQLVRAGYRWEPLAECMGTLRWKDKSKPITCDAPAMPQGSKQDPVVLAMPKGTPPASSVSTM